MQGSNLARTSVPKSTFYVFRNTINACRLKHWPPRMKHVIEITVMASLRLSKIASNTTINAENKCGYRMLRVCIKGLWGGCSGAAATVE